MLGSSLLYRLRVRVFNLNIWANLWVEFRCKFIGLLNGEKFTVSKLLVVYYESSLLVVLTDLVHQAIFWLS